MPLDESVGLDDAQCAAPLKEPAKSGHHEPLDVCRSVWHRFALLEEGQLFAEEEILGS